MTEMIGSGVNGVTGDYSRGAAGFWIENGELAYPVPETLVIAGLMNHVYERPYALIAPLTVVRQCGPRPTDHSPFTYVPSPF